MSLRGEATSMPQTRTERSIPGRFRPTALRIIVAALGSAMVLGLPFTLQAQEDEGWLGKRVVQKYDTFRLGLGGQGVVPKMIHTYRVEKVNGQVLWIRVEGQGPSGWAPADQVVPVEQAIEFFTDYIRTHRTEAFGYVMRARIWRMEKKDLDRALTDYGEAIRLDPTRAWVYVGRATAWHAKKEYQKAIADFNVAIRLDPQDPVNYLDRAITWRALKEEDKAIADCNEAIRLDPKLPNAYITRGRAFKEKQEYDAAIADYSEAIRLDSKFGLAHNNLAWLLATCPDAQYRDGKRAIEGATRACELSGWRVPNNLDTLAAAHAEAGDFESAARWQARAIELLDDETTRDDYRTRLELYRENKPHRK
jgi:tetratricopeptide (TPR) repeat protein